MAKLLTPLMLFFMVKLWLLALLSREVVGDCGPWSDWTPCSVTCGTGSESRTRDCTTQEPGNEVCRNQLTTETKTCGKNACPAKITFEEVGCFKEVSSDRALPTLVADLKQQVDWHDLTKTVRACAQLVHKTGWAYFGIQEYAMCYSGPSVHYNKHGASTDCWRGVGKSKGANFVYKFKSAN